MESSEREKLLMYVTRHDRKYLLDVVSAPAIGSDYSLSFVSDPDPQQKAEELQRPYDLDRAEAEHPSGA